MNINQCPISPLQNSTIQARPIAPPQLFDQISDQIEFNGHDREAQLDQMLRLGRMAQSSKPLGDAAMQVQHGAGQFLRNVSGGHDPGEIIRNCGEGVSQMGLNLINNGFQQGDRFRREQASHLGQGIDNLGRGAANLMDGLGLHQMADNTRNVGHNLGQGAADLTYGAGHLAAQVVRGAASSVAEIPKDLTEVVTQPGETVANLCQLADHPVETVVNHFQQQCKQEGVAYAIGHLLPDVCGGELLAGGRVAHEVGAVAEVGQAAREARMLETVRKGMEHYREYGEQANELNGTEFHRGRLI